MSAAPRKVIVTGAGSGIGKEFARLFLADGSTVLAVSLLQDELDRLTQDPGAGPGRLELLQMDLGQPDSAERLLAWCDSHDWMPDILVNNAGFACFGPAVDVPVAKLQAMITLNVLTLTKSSMLFGQRMQQRGRGRILNVGSTAGMMPAQRMAAYCATKSYVNAFTFALAAELAPSGVTVTCLTPGATQTNFAKAGDIDSFGGKSLLKDMFAGNKAGSPRQVAEAGYRGLLAGRRHVLAGKGAGVAAVLSRLLPQRMLPGLIKNM